MNKKILLAIIIILIFTAGIFIWEYKSKIKKNTLPNKISSSNNSPTAPPINKPIPTNNNSDKAYLEFPFLVDSTLTQLDCLLMFSKEIDINDFKNDFKIKVIDTNGIEQPLSSIYPSDLSKGNAGYYSFKVNLADDYVSGIWKVLVFLKSGKHYDDVKITSDISGKGKFISYALSIENMTGNIVQYPSPILVNAVLQKDLPIAGAKVYGTIKSPDGTIIPLLFRDDGKAPDYMPNDGSYATILNDYSLNGTYKVEVSADNSNNTAFLTYNGLMTEGGYLSDKPVGENFERRQFFYILL